MKFDLKLIGYITTFENITHAKVRDCFFDKDEILVFVVDEGEIGKAIGKNGSNVKRISFVLKKRLKIIEFSKDPVVFVKNCLQPLKVNASLVDGKVVIKCETKQEKGLVFGRDRNNFHAMQELIKKFYPVEIVVE